MYCVYDYHSYLIFGGVRNVSVSSTICFVSNNTKFVPKYLGFEFGLCRIELVNCKGAKSRKALNLGSVFPEQQQVGFESP